MQNYLFISCLIAKEKKTFLTTTIILREFNTFVCGLEVF